MKQGLTVLGMVIYGGVMAATVVLNLVIQVGLFTGGNIGGAILYLIFGWTITLTIGYWIGMLLAAPFAIVGALGADRGDDG